MFNERVDIFIINDAFYAQARVLCGLYFRVVCCRLFGYLRADFAWSRRDWKTAREDINIFFSYNYEDAIISSIAGNSCASCHTDGCVRVSVTSSRANFVKSHDMTPRVCNVASCRKTQRGCRHCGIFAIAPRSVQLQTGFTTVHMDKMKIIAAMYNI